MRIKDIVAKIVCLDHTFQTQRGELYSHAIAVKCYITKTPEDACVTKLVLHRSARIRAHSIER